jgi:hypothetical protein
VIDGRLHPDDVEAIARQVAALLRDEPQAPRLLTAEQVAGRFGVTSAWVRQHAVELGALRLGAGPRPRLRFNADTVGDALTACCGSRGSTTPEAPVPTTGAVGCGARRAGNGSGFCLFDSYDSTRHNEIAPAPHERPGARPTRSKPHEHDEPYGGEGMTAPAEEITVKCPFCGRR